MADKAWKKFERDVASFLGGRRIPVAEDGQQLGALGDIELEGCLISCRLRSKGSAEAWWWEIEPRARRSGRVPVVIFRRPRKKGVLVLLCLYHIVEFFEHIDAARKKQWGVSTRAQPAPKPRAILPEEL